MRAALGHILLCWRLFRDPRVSVFAKLVPFAAVLYLISPVDCLSDIAFPGIGYLDDAVVLMLALRLFLLLAPRRVVMDHLYWLSHASKRPRPRWRFPRRRAKKEDDRQCRIPIP